MRQLLFSIGLICLGIFQVNAQDGRLNDFEIWAKLAAEKDLTERFKFGVEEQIRFDKNSSELKNFFTEISLNYDLSDNLALLGRARFLTRNDNSGADQGRKDYFRYQLGLRLKHKSGQFRFNHRLLYQRRDRFNLSPEEGDVIGRQQNETLLGPHGHTGRQDFGRVQRVLNGQLVGGAMVKSRL